MSLMQKAEQAYKQSFGNWHQLPFHEREARRAEAERKHSIWGRAIKRHYDRCLMS